MNKTTFIIVSVAVLVTLIGIVLFVSWNHSPKPAQVPGTSFPVSGTTTASGSALITVASMNGVTIPVRNFMDDQGVIHNPNNNIGYNILVGTDDPSAPIPPYEIDYSAKDQSFGITLYKEPLGSNRKLAEQDLMHRLGISQTQMCSLRYVLAVGPGVNDTYASQNLGFSFCPGAAQLPY